MPSCLNMEPDKTQEGFQWVKQELLNRILLQATDPRVYPCKLTQSLLYNGSLHNHKRQVWWGKIFVEPHNQLHCMHSNIFILHVSLIYTLEENSILITWDKAEDWVTIDLQNNSTSQSWVRPWLHETGMNSGQYNKVYVTLLWKYEAITWDQYKLRSVGF